MPAPPASLRVSAPGRICLFGEHQDYLHLPVIPAAIALRITVDARARRDRVVAVDLPDIGSRQSFSLDGPLDYAVKRDYLRSAVNVLRRHGYTFSRGLDCTVRGNIPINAGTSSSSALVVSWIHTLLRASDQGHAVPAQEIARFAHEAEVVEFGEPGGMMDHCASACGGLLYLEFEPALTVTPMHARPGPFVLGNSGEPKDTHGVLSSLKNRVRSIVRKIAVLDPSCSLRTLRQRDVAQFSGLLDASEFALLEGTVVNHELTLHARQLLESTPFDHHGFGALLGKHHAVLRDALRISTPRIERMLEAAVAAGAPGGKINGSGGGGCMVAYAPDDPERVAEAVTRAGGTATIVQIDEGSREEVVQQQSFSGGDRETAL